MASLRDIKKRISNIDNIEQVSQSMKTISTAKLSYARAIKYDNAEYFTSTDEIINTLFNLHKTNTKSSGVLFNALFTPSGEENTKARNTVAENTGENPKTLIILISADTGLCGSYNAHTYKMALQLITSSKNNYILVPIGNKARIFAKKYPQANIIDANISSNIKKLKNDSLVLLSNYILHLVKSAAIQNIKIVHTKSISILQQEVQITTLLPLTSEENETKVKSMPKEDTTTKHFHTIVTDEHKFTETLEELFKQYLVAQLYNKIINSSLAEHSSRLTAMDNAHNNCKELKRDLKLQYNRVRQGLITKELIEIISGAEAL